MGREDVPPRYRSMYDILKGPFDDDTIKKYISTHIKEKRDKKIKQIKKHIDGQQKK